MATQTIDPAAGPKPGGRRHLAGARVLVVDDSPSVLAFASAALKAAGSEVRTSAEIWIASSIREFAPDVVLIDVNLSGGCSGPAVVRALKRHAVGRAVRFVLYSTTPADRLSELALECGADASLHKDGDPGALVRSIGAVLGD
jgi:DNA-binding response OmpR family regulator